jgi:hypothetical protein
MPDRFIPAANDAPDAAAGQKQTDVQPTALSETAALQAATLGE